MLYWLCGYKDLFSNAFDVILDCMIDESSYRGFTLPKARLDKVIFFFR